MMSIGMTCSRLKNDFPVVRQISKYKKKGVTMLMSTSTALPVGEMSTGNWHRFGDAQADALLQAFEMTNEPDVQTKLIHQLQQRFVEMCPAIPLFLAPSWGTYTSARYVGFPTEADPYARLSPNSQPDCLLVLDRLRPRDPGPEPAGSGGH